MMRTSPIGGGRNVKPILYLMGVVLGIVGFLMLLLRTLMLRPASDPFGWQRLPWWIGIEMMVFAVMWIGWARDTKPDDWRAWVEAHSIERERFVFGIKIGLPAGLVWGLFAAVAEMVIWSVSLESAVLLLVNRAADGSLVGAAFFRIRQSFPARYLTAPPDQGAVFAVFVWSLGELLGVLLGFVGPQMIYDLRRLLGLLVGLAGTMIFGWLLGYFYQRRVGDLA